MPWNSSGVGRQARQRFDTSLVRRGLDMRAADRLSTMRLSSPTSDALDGFAALVGQTWHAVDADAQVVLASSPSRIRALAVNAPYMTNVLDRHRTFMGSHPSRP